MKKLMSMLIDYRPIIKKAFYLALAVYLILVVITLTGCGMETTAYESAGTVERI